MLLGMSTTFGRPKSNLSPREQIFVSAITAAGMEGGAGAYYAGIKDYPSKVACAILDGYEDPKAIMPILAASDTRESAAGGEMQISILMAVLLASGDDAFSEALEKTSPAIRQMVCGDLVGAFEYVLSPKEIRFKKRYYPKTYKIIEQTIGPRKIRS